MVAAKANRYGHRDATMVLLAYRHGLRASDLVDLRWDQIDFDHASLAVRRAKKGTPSTHPIRGDELRALRRLARGQDPKSPFVYTSERGVPFTTVNGVLRSPRLALPAWSSALAPWLAWSSRPIPTCYGTPVASSWPIRATTPGRSRPILATRTSSTPCDTRNCRRIGSKTSGAEGRLIPMPYQIQANMHGSGFTVVVETAAEALDKMGALHELGATDVVTRDLDGLLIDRAQLETEATSQT
jgi:hypothetical protein